MEKFRAGKTARGSFDVGLYASMELWLRIDGFLAACRNLIVAYIHGLIAHRSYKRNNETQPCLPAFRKNPWPPSNKRSRSTPTGRALARWPLPCRSGLRIAHCKIG